MGEWKRAKLGEVCEFQRGYDLPHAKMLPGNYPVIGSSGIIGWHNDYTTEAPSISIGRSGSVGRPFLYRGKSWSHNTALYIKDFKSNDPIFVYYFLFAVRPWEYGGGSAVPTLNRNDLHGLDVVLPSLPTQRKIAAVLGALDDKIENNRKICANLEAQAQALFKSWFVDFEPFGGKMPSGWKMGKLGDVAKINRDSITPEEMPEIVEHYSLPAFDSSRLPVYEQASTIKSNKFRVSKGSLLISKLNPSIKRLWDPFVDTDTAVSSTEFVVIVPDKVESKSYIYSVLDSQPFFAYAKAHAAGTTNSHQRVSPEDILRYEIVIPSERAILDFDFIIRPLLEMKKGGLKQSSSLAATRDALLPKLMSGEIDVEKVAV